MNTFANNAEGRNIKQKLVVLLALASLSLATREANAEHTCPGNLVACHTRYGWEEPVSGATTYTPWQAGRGSGGGIFWSRTCTTPRCRYQVVVPFCCDGNWNWFWAWDCTTYRKFNEKEVLDAITANQTTTKCNSSQQPQVSFTRPTLFNWGVGVTPADERGPMPQMAAEVNAVTQWPDAVLDAQTFAAVYNIMGPRYQSAGSNFVSYGNQGLALGSPNGPVDHTPDLLLIQVGNGLMSFANEMNAGVPVSGAGLQTAANALNGIVNHMAGRAPYVVVNPIMTRAATALSQAQARIQAGLITQEDHRQLLSHLEDFSDEMANYAREFAVATGINPIPTISQWGLIILGLLVLTIGTVFILRQRVSIPAMTALG